MARTVGVNGVLLNDLQKIGISNAQELFRDFFL